MESVAEALGGLPWVTERTDRENDHTGEYLKDSSALSAVTQNLSPSFSVSHGAITPEEHFSSHSFTSGL